MSAHKSLIFALAATSPSETWKWGLAQWLRITFPAVLIDASRGNGCTWVIFSFFRTKRLPLLLRPSSEISTWSWIASSKVTSFSNSTFPSSCTNARCRHGDSRTINHRTHCTKRRFFSVIWTKPRPTWITGDWSFLKVFVCPGILWFAPTKPPPPELPCCALN